MISPKRTVRFTVVTTRLTVEELTEAIDLQPDETRMWTRREPHQHSWEIHEYGNTTADVSTMIENVLTRARQAQTSLIRLCNEPDVVCHLRVVLYIEGDDKVKVGPGFAVSPENLHFLAELNASIDADLYGLGSDEED